MGSWANVSNLLNEGPQTPPEAQEVLPLCQYSTKLLRQQTDKVEVATIGGWYVWGLNGP